MKQKLLTHVLLGTLVLAGLVVGSAELAFATSDASEMCAGNGGKWKGISSTDGACTFPINHAYTLGSCAAGDIFITIWVADTLDSTQCNSYAHNTSLAYGSTVCWLLGGSHDETGSIATCTLTHTVIGDCGAGTTIYTFDLSLGYPFGMTTQCFTPAAGIGASSGGGSASTPVRSPGFGRFGNGITSEDDGSAKLGGGKNGWFFYNSGTCSGSCSVGAALPKGAKASKPNGTVSTMYVRMVDGDGNPSYGSYSVCFDPGNLNPAVIYRFVSGAWVAQPAYTSGGLICTTASGDGAFALAK